MTNFAELPLRIGVAGVLGLALGCAGPSEKYDGGMLGAGPGTEHGLAGVLAHPKGEPALGDAAPQTAPPAEDRRAPEDAPPGELERAADDASRDGDLAGAVAGYTRAIVDGNPGDAAISRLREKALKAAADMPEPPAVPEAARRHAIRGQAMLKTAATDGFGPAIKEFEMAVWTAPWWTDGWHNLGLAYESAERFSEAVYAFRLYLLGGPPAKDAAAVRDKLYALEVSQERERAASGLAGLWVSGPGNTYRLSVDGRTLKGVTEHPKADSVHSCPWSSDPDICCFNCVALFKETVPWDFRYRFEGTVNGSTFTGTVEVPEISGFYPCKLPRERVPATGTIGPDGSFALTFGRPIYDHKSNTPFLGPTVCVHVTLRDKVQTTLTLRRR